MTQFIPGIYNKIIIKIIGYFLGVTAKVARLIAVAASDVKARAEDNLTRVLDALAVVEEDGRRLEVEVARLAVE